MLSSVDIQEKDTPSGEVLRRLVLQPEKDGTVNEGLYDERAEVSQYISPNYRMRRLT